MAQSTDRRNYSKRHGILQIKSRSDSLSKHSQSRSSYGESIFQQACGLEYLHESPCAKVKDIRVVDETRAFLSTEELDKLLKYLKGSFLHDIVLFAAMTGMRRGGSSTSHGTMSI